ncbi:Hypothetical protein FKW44_020332 [Caligus rogercresseyi]|uniref:Uncharacterized protein n=1 Tax=Caligus rogercresseyi TaxID=217165 RepID=A0A7T8JY12_CALRO|nr:Hypothetical protein FKW44_020332 [Caligus rogercresseyi]
MGSASKALEAYSNINGLHLNAGKIQTLRLGAPDTPSTATLDLLGVTVSRNLTFGPHHEKLFRMSGNESESSAGSALRYREGHC